MLRPDPRIERVYLHCAPVVMRRQIDGLSLLAKDVMQMDPMSGAMFVFINARRNRLKLLVWERNGLVTLAASGSLSGRSTRPVAELANSRAPGLKADTRSIAS
jgi:transposase